MQIKIPFTIFFFIILLSTTLPTITTAGNPLPPPSTAGSPLPPPSAALSPVAPPSTDKDFIRTSCRTTLYPQTCFTSLSGYSTSVQQSPGRLARVAIGVTLSKATHMTNYVANISRHADYEDYNSSPRVAAAVHDCVTVFGDAVDQIRGSLRQMRRLRGTGESVRFQVSNVQTWMSAALTNMETCTDGFEDVAENGGVKAEVCRRAVEVKEVTSNALALINGFANMIQTP